MKKIKNIHDFEQLVIKDIENNKIIEYNKTEICLFDIGHLLDETDDEFSAYASYDKKYGYYDITQCLFLKDNLEKQIEYAKSQVKLYKNSYCVITYQDSLLLTNDDMKHLDDIEFIDFVEYTTDRVIYSIMQDNNGNIIENFIK